jgi:hypothetical protein
LLVALITLLITAPFASAHPVKQGLLTVTVYPGELLVHARISVEEVSIANSMTGDNPLPGPWAAAGTSAFAQHADYLASHLHFIADGAALAGRVVNVIPPDDSSLTEKTVAVYELEYPFAKKSPAAITFSHDSLADIRQQPGADWSVLYNVTMSQPGRSAMQAVLSRGEKMAFAPNWSASGAGAPSAPSRIGLFKSYCIHGVNHILGEPTGRGIFSRTDVGFDHLLFVTALVLGTKSLWDLLKVVTAFTLAHTITLTLATLKLVNVPESVSEPLIAASIVFVAVQNVFWPRQSRGALRYAAAFFFGLFHGLGFAGGLLDTMQQLQGTIIFLAILAFSIGVELGHQMVVIPLFLLLKLWRDTRAGEPARDRLHFNVQRFGSAGISLAGLFYLVVALKMSFRAA